VVKLKSGYNVGIGVARVSGIRRLAEGERPSFTSSPPRPRMASASLDPRHRRDDSQPGRLQDRAVHAAISAEDLYSLMPELSDIANISPEIVVSVYSENLEPEHWEKIAAKVSECVARGARGVIVTTGTDVMGYTSAALSFALQKVPVPVFVVGSQSPPTGPPLTRT